MPKAKHPFAEFGERLRVAREALGYLDAADFARKLDMNEHTYQNYERGDRFPNPWMCAQLARLGVSLNWIFVAQPPAVNGHRR